jgi:peptidoglycan/xylan/chitin deacetylase (PgdA/CDA1 family)
MRETIEQVRSTVRGLGHAAAVQIGGWSRAALRRQAGGMVALTSHAFTASRRVGPLGEQPADAFRIFLDRIRRHYEVVTVHEGLRRIEAGATDPNRPLATLTVDDGYADNFDVLFPVLQASGVPATFFVATEFLDEGRPPWPVEISALLLQAEKSSIEWPFAAALAGRRDVAEASAAIKALWRTSDPAARREALEALRRHLDLPRPVMPRPMTWDQCRSLQRAGHAIGSHTHFHSILPGMPEPVIRAELDQSRRRIEAELGEPCDLFAYPNGDSDSACAHLVREAGYAVAFTQDAGVIRSGADPLRLPRMHLPPYEHASSLQFRLAAA